MSSYEDRVENMARKEYEANRYEGQPPWDRLPDSRKIVLLSNARLRAGWFMEGAPLFEAHGTMFPIVQMGGLVTALYPANEGDDPDGIAVESLIRLVPEDE